MHNPSACKPFEIFNVYSATSMQTLNVHIVNSSMKNIYMYSVAQ